MDYFITTQIQNPKILKLNNGFQLFFMGVIKIIN